MNITQPINPPDGSKPPVILPLCGELKDNSMSTVFISYGKEDLISAHRLYAQIKGWGLTPWLDVECLKPGQNWRTEIRKAIRNTRFFVALMSSKTVSRKGFVNKELAAALDILDEFPDSEIFIIPMRLDVCEPPFERLRDLQRVDMFPKWSIGLQQLRRSFGLASDPNLELGGLYESNIRWPETADATQSPTGPLEDETKRKAEALSGRYFLKDLVFMLEDLSALEAWSMVISISFDHTQEVAQMIMQPNGVDFWSNHQGYIKDYAKRFRQTAESHGLEVFPVKGLVKGYFVAIRGTLNHVAKIAVEMIEDIYEADIDMPISVEVFT